MGMRIRCATSSDIPALFELAMANAHSRSTLKGELWAITSDAAARTKGLLETVANPVMGPIRHHWVVAEAGNSIVGFAHAANLPAPPMVDLKGGNAGIIFEDSHFPENRETSARLLVGAEHALRDAGAVLYIAASAAGSTSMTAFFKTKGYELTTLYVVKSGLQSSPISSKVRSATDADVGGIVRLSALHRARLQAANPFFWNIDALADARFAMWMTASLSLSDRAMFVAGQSDNIAGYLIAQPCPPFLLPATHDPARVGLIDDFYAAAFEADNFEPGSDVPEALLSAAEEVFAKRGVTIALGICPAKMPHKASSFARRGYRTAFAWMVRDARA